MPHIADRAADNGVVLLLDKAVVVLSIGARTGKSDLFLLAVALEFVIDELASVIRVNSKQTEG